MRRSTGVLVVAIASSWMTVAVTAQQPEPFTRAWTAELDSPAYSEYAHDVQVDGAGNAYVATDAGLLKYDPDGQLVWHVADLRVRRILTTASGVTYTTGHDLATGARHVLAIDSTGATAWSAATTVDFDHFVLDASGDLVAAGTRRFSRDGFAASETTVARFDPVGATLWSAPAPFGDNSAAAGLAVDSQGHVVVASCALQGTIGYGVVSFDSTGARLWDAFFAGSYNGPAEQLECGPQDDIYLATLSHVIKLDSQGRFLAAHDIGFGFTPQLDIGPCGDVYVAGSDWVTNTLTRLDRDLVENWSVDLGDGLVRDMVVDDLGNAYLAGDVNRPHYPYYKMRTWSYSSAGSMRFYEENPDLYYAAGYGIAIGPDHAFFNAGYTWSYARGYGSGVTKYSTSQIQVVEDVLAVLGALPSAVFDREASRESLVRKLETVRDFVGEGNHAGAARLIRRQVLPKMDGCAISGAPDGNDVVLDCDAQCRLHPPLSGLAAWLES